MGELLAELHDERLWSRELCEVLDEQKGKEGPARFQLINAGQYPGMRGRDGLEVRTSIDAGHAVHRTTHEAGRTTRLGGVRGGGLDGIRPGCIMAWRFSAAMQVGRDFDEGIFG